MKKDIETREDIVNLVDTFYRQVLIDPEIAYLFTEVAQLNLDRHMPVMYNFWESMPMDRLPQMPSERLVISPT